MRSVLLLPFLALGLASCGSEAEEPKERMTQEQIDAEVAELPEITPGLYKRTTTVLDLTVPGASEEDLAKMRKEAAGENSTREECITEEGAAKGYRDLVRGMGEAQDGLSCDFSKFDADGSTIDAALSCDAVMGTGADIAITGTVAPESSDMTLDMAIDLGFVGAMAMKLNMKSERIGSCDADAAASESNI